MFTFDQLGQIGGVLGLDSDSHNGRHGELHDLHVVRLLEGGDCACLDEVLIHAHQPADVSGRHILNGLHLAAGLTLKNAPKKTPKKPT
jgi:hypothetical protein